MQEGQILGGRYRLGSRIGTGSFGAVYEGQHASLAQQVAIKVFRTDVVTMVGGPDRVLADAKAASRVHHRNIVDVYDLGKTDQTVYVVAERVVGRTLHEHLVRSGRLPWSRARGVALQIAAALKAAHKRNVLHRGLRAANCFVLEDPTASTDELRIDALRIKVSDFGFAHPGLAGGSRGEEHTSPFVGDAAYTAPELSHGGAPTVRSDLYAFGVLLYRMVTGALPFEGATPFQVLAAHVERPVPSPRQRVSSLPEALDAVIMRALAKDPGERFESARELEVALDEVPPETEGEPTTSEPEAEGAPEAALEEGVTGEHRRAEPPPAAASRDEAMHAAFERRDEDVGVPTSTFDRRTLAPYFGPPVTAQELPPEPTVVLGASLFALRGAPAPVGSMPVQPPESTIVLSSLPSPGAAAAAGIPPTQRLTGNSFDGSEEPTTCFRAGRAPTATVALPPFEARHRVVPAHVPGGPAPIAPHVAAARAPMPMAPLPSHEPLVRPRVHTPAMVQATLAHAPATLSMTAPGPTAISATSVLLIGAAVALAGALLGLAIACPARGTTRLHPIELPADHAHPGRTRHA